MEIAVFVGRVFSEVADADVGAVGDEVVVASHVGSPAIGVRVHGECIGEVPSEGVAARPLASHVCDDVCVAAPIEGDSGVELCQPLGLVLGEPVCAE